ncbi:hypothetical protein GGX14DRAFT_566821 [Mycena pura]|uniref:Uncharacterized protein n=1 Tax=Mycena pura TaxID=153505 RepID=A0AAD6VD20_9AGAR|nr:hypothetical protein GGX14DRAFT_566821 [Mycena pura]
MVPGCATSAAPFKAATSNATPGTLSRPSLTSPSQTMVTRSKWLRLVSDSCLATLALAPAAQAQSAGFRWQFTDSAPTFFTTCDLVSVTVSPETTGGAGLGMPPYYMMSFPAGGTPLTELIGTNASDLKWVPRHPDNTQLMLMVIDSNGTSGGVKPTLFNMRTGTSTSCLAPPTPDFSTFNISGNSTVVSTCEPWGLRIDGGEPPYTVILASTGWNFPTNVTLGPMDSVFTFINRAAPMQHLLAAVTDATGRWASGIPLVKTIGSWDTECTGMVSSSGTDLSFISSSPSSRSTDMHRRTVIASLIVAALILLCLAGILVWWWRRRRRAHNAVVAEISAVSPFDYLTIYAERQTAPNEFAEPSVVSVWSSARSKLPGPPHGVSPQSDEMPPPYA